MIGSPRSGSLPASIAVGEAVAVALGRQVALELRDEQAAVGEDQDPERAGGLDEAGGGDRLSGGGRVAEAVAADGAGILADEPSRLVLVVVVLDSTSSSSSASSGSSSASACPLPFPFSSSSRGAGLPRSARSAFPRARRSGACAARCRRRSWAASRRGRARAPAGSRSGPSSAARGRAAGLDLGERLVERGAAGRAGRQHLGGLFAGVEDGLARPVLRAERVGPQAIRRVRRVCRVKYRF